MHAFSEADGLNEALIDAYHDGMDAFRSGVASPYADGPFAEAWADGRRDAERASRVRVVMSARPEGYYHAPVGTFD